MADSLILMSEIDKLKACHDEQEKEIALLKKQVKGREWINNFLFYSVLVLLYVEFWPSETSPLKVVVDFFR